MDSRVPSVAAHDAYIFDANQLSDINEHRQRAVPLVRGARSHGGTLRVGHLDEEDVPRRSAVHTAGRGVAQHTKEDELQQHRVGVCRNDVADVEVKGAE